MAAVLLAVGWRVWSLLAELNARQEGEWATRVQAGWLLLAAGMFLGGAALYGLFWHRVLSDSGVEVTRRTALRAYFAGSVGKYVPGKAWVVVFRASLLGRTAGEPLLLGMTSVYETMAQMAVGAAFGFVCLLGAPAGPWQWRVAAGAVAVGLAALLYPAVFSRLARLLTLPFRARRGNCIPRVRARTLGMGLVLIGGGWMLWGASMVAVLHGIGVEVTSATACLWAAAAAALATTGGFLVPFMPSGIAIRELIIIELLSPGFGVASAVVASLLLRVIWTLAEVGSAGVLYVLGPRRAATDADSPAPS
ncbi:MAG TPA: lysylphosphatidylglycerol synthase domain-containing protein [Phycisphaerae bacterium]|nr:lysylphosphatidylglycerol synthase domain-containing protein [Phycisphaerae bacterium]HNU45035.1 lysylphosphatidylglycerol synthase domain-containing protein [Phycisphaerae bacterium]